MKNEVWKIDPETHDLVFDETGTLITLQDDEASAQSIWLTLNSWKGDFPLVPSHGTDYGQILGRSADEDLVDEVIREAVFQEKYLAALEELVIKKTEKRGLQIQLSGILDDGETVSVEVTAGE